MKCWLFFGIFSVYFFRSTIGADISGSPSGNQFYLGILLPFNEGWSVGRLIVSAVDIGIESIAAQNLLTGYTIDYGIKDTKCNLRHGLKMALDLYEETDDIDGYIGGGCSEVCKPVALISSAWNLPFVSFGCNTEELSSKYNYPTFTRTVGVWASLAPMIDRIADNYGWERVGILMTSETILQLTGGAAKSALEDSSGGHRAKSVYSYTIDTTVVGNETNVENMEKAIQTLKKLKSETRGRYLN